MDASMVDIKGTVTAEDMGQGLRGNRYRCPFALAVNRALAEAGYPNLRAGVGQYTVHAFRASAEGKPYWNNDQDVAWQTSTTNLPTEVSKAIRDFDGWYGDSSFSLTPLEFSLTFSRAELERVNAMNDSPSEDDGRGNVVESP